MTPVCPTKGDGAGAQVFVAEQRVHRDEQYQPFQQRLVNLARMARDRAAVRENHRPGQPFRGLAAGDLWALLNLLKNVGAFLPVGVLLALVPRWSRWSRRPRISTGGRWWSGC